jgi:DNA-binding transcriptional MerR regulator
VSSSAQEPESLEIPNKLYFRIGEVARLAGVKPYVLRYWESEFAILEPKKSGTNHRLYRRKDVETVLEIKRLLYEKRYTIEGARKYFGGGKNRGEAAKPKPVKQVEMFPPAAPPLEAIRRELQQILDLLR